jgi:hypothetical protein
LQLPWPGPDDPWETGAAAPTPYQISLTKCTGAPGAKRPGAQVPNAQVSQVPNAQVPQVPNAQVPKVLRCSVGQTAM